MKIKTETLARITLTTLFTLLLVLLITVLLGCASAPERAPPPLLGEVRTEVVKVAVPVPCVNEADIPKRPPTNMPPPDSDVARLMAGAVADARTQSAYSSELEAVIRACVAAGGTKK